MRGCSTCTSISWRCHRIPSGRSRPAISFGISCRTLAISATCQRMSMCCAATIGPWSRPTRKGLRPTGNSWSATGAINFYSLYRCHNYHFKIYGAMFLGQYAPAIAAAEEMIGTLSEDLLTVESPPMADWLEGFVPMKQHVLIRFGKWREILAQELPGNPELYCTTAAMMRYARAVAHGVLGDVGQADAEAARFDEALARVPDTRYVFNNRCLDILTVAREMMLGEIEYPPRGVRTRLRPSPERCRSRRQPSV